jgi:Flp pilus assembly protein protease CpaA
MAPQLQSAALLGFATLMVLAAFEDLRRLVIPNALTLSLCLTWPLYVIASPSLFGVLGSLGCGVAVFLAGAFCFSRGYISHVASLARARLGPDEATAKIGGATPVPYGIAIAAAAMIVVFVPHFR